MAGNYTLNGIIYDENGMTVGIAPSHNGIPAVGSTPAPDPNYNPGFFGWLWDGIRDPVGAKQTFENNVLAPIARRTDEILSPVTGQVDNLINNNGVVGQAIGAGLNSGASWSNAPAQGAQPNYNGIVNGAVQNEQGRQMPLQAGNPGSIGSGKGLWDGSGGGWTADNVYNEPGQPNGPSGGPGGFAQRNTPLNPAGTQTGIPANQMSNDPAQTGIPANQIDNNKSWLDTLTGNSTLMGGLGTVVGAGTSLIAGNTVANAEREAADKEAEGRAEAARINKEVANQARTDLEPWRKSGEGALWHLNRFDEDNPEFSQGDFFADPSYSFRLNEGMKALENSAAARGGLLSGNTLKAVTNYAGQSASQEYQNAYNRSRQSRQDKRNGYEAIAGLGQSGASQTVQSGQNYGLNAGNAAVGGSNALAAGIRGAGDANASSYIGVGNVLTNHLNETGRYGREQNTVNSLRGGY